MADFLYSIDLSIFYFFNHTISTGFLDKFFSIITNVNNWYVAYVILLFICYFKGGTKGKIAVLGIVLLVLFTDQIGHKVLKEIVQRIRPCNALSDVITPLGCNGTFSFPSNHALNNFAAATFFYILFPRLKWALFITASLISVSRVYLGLHYPSDILGGAIIGSCFGYIFALGVLKIDSIVKKRKYKSEKSNNNKIIIRVGEEDDVPTIMSFIKELAEYEKLLGDVIVTEDSLKKKLFGEKKYAEVLIAEYEGKPAGQALFFHNFSTFIGKPGIYLEDLYVTPNLRGKGIGKALLNYLIKIAKERDCGRVEWTVLDWNTPSIEFYKKMGALPMNDWTVFRLTDDKF